jgi:hypothetical protein
VPDPAACVDPDGFVRVRFLDSAAIRREQLDRLHLESLHAEIHVGPISNRAPIASDDTASTLIGEPVQIDLLANDSDPDGNPIWISELPVSSQSGATLTHQEGSGIVTYTPLAGFTGTDGFQYSISDGDLSADATVTVTVVDTPNPNLTVHIQSIVLSSSRAGKNWKATAAVTVVDQHGGAVGSASVRGDWFFDAAAIQIDSTATTDLAGVATLSSPTVKADTGTFTFRVTRIDSTTGSYASELNVQTESSLQVP